MNDSMTCVVEGCWRVAAARGWCRGHWQRVMRSGGDPGSSEFRRSPGSTPPRCKVDRCESPAASRGWCRAHYQRWYDGRDMDAPVATYSKTPPAPCSFDGCDSASTALGLCNRHYQARRRAGEAVDPRRYGGSPVCSSEGCSRPHRARGYCDLHYRRFRRGWDPNSLKFKAIPRPADLESYFAIHRLLAKERGPAKNQICPCGDVARQWAYQHNDPNYRMSEAGHRYSLDIYGSYIAMCQTCHNLLDRNVDERARRAEQVGT